MPKYYSKLNYKLSEMIPIFLLSLSLFLPCLSFVDGVTYWRKETLCLVNGNSSGEAVFRANFTGRAGCEWTESDRIQWKTDAGYECYKRFGENAGGTGTFRESFDPSRGDKTGASPFVVEGTRSRQPRKMPSMACEYAAPHIAQQCPYECGLCCEEVSFNWEVSDMRIPSYTLTKYEWS